MYRDKDESSVGAVNQEDRAAMDLEGVLRAKFEAMKVCRAVFPANPALCNGWPSEGLTAMDIPQVRMDAVLPWIDGEGRFVRMPRRWPVV
jgi:hypothetical protein